MINCPECGKQVSDKAPNCPACAFPINKNAEGNNQPKPSNTLNLCNNCQKERPINSWLCPHCHAISFKQSIKFGCLFIFLIALVNGICNPTHRSSDRTTTTAQSVEPAQTINYSGTNGNIKDALDDLFGAGLTQDQIEELFSRKYKNKIFIANGTIRDIGTFIDQKYITIKINGSHYVDAYPSAGFDILSCRKGQDIVVKGVFDDVGTGIMVKHKLRNAEIVK